jgi:hypothetical protein
MTRTAGAPARGNIGSLPGGRQRRDGKERAAPRRSVRGRLWQATERTQFKKGRSGNPYGRPRKKPDLYGELTKVLRENVTITVDGQREKVTVQQALLLRLRDEALRGELWAQKLLQKVVGALPERGSESDYIEMQLQHFRIQALFNLVFEESGLDLAELAADSGESTHDE